MTIFATMNIIREHVLAKVFTLITGLIFLNMSFFLAEVALLKFEKKELVENIAKLIFNGGFEEERECEGNVDHIGKEVDLLMQQVEIHHACSFLVSVRSNQILVDHYLHANHSLTFSPPPDFNNFS
jgi:hypothetical protein